MDKNFFPNHNLFCRNKNILVTGGAGFIGGALIRNLLKKSDCKIYNLDKLNYSSDLTSINLTLENLNHKGETKYKFLKVDLAKEEEVNKAIKVVNPDLIFHLAAESHVDRSIDNPFNFISSNILGTFYLLQASLKHFENLNNKRKENFRFVHISTDEVFGSLNEKGYFCENTKYDPRSPYSASKASSDHLVSSWYHTYGLPSIITNCTNNFGPWQFPEKLIPLVIFKALMNEDIPIYGSGNNIRDWLYVDDHINGILLAAQKGIPGKKYCIGGNNEKSNKEVVEIICTILDEELSKGLSYKKLIKFVKNRPGHDFRYAIDSTLIRKELGWEPKYSFENAIRDTTIWYLNNQVWCKKMLKISNYGCERIGLFKT